jgi:hypothetical protein
LKFGTRSGSKSPTRIECEQGDIATVTETKFLGLCIDDTLFWKRQIEQVVNKMASACYALRNIKHIVSTEMLKLIYFAQVHSIINYGIIFWGSAPSVHKVFIMQKRIIRIITNTKPRESCRKFFKMMGIMTLYSQYIYSLLLFVINNEGLFIINDEIHEHETRVYKDIHMPATTLKRNFLYHSFYSMNEYYQHAKS